VMFAHMVKVKAISESPADPIEARMSLPIMCRDPTPITR
jgi:hypothetical protein